MQKCSRTTADLHTIADMMAQLEVAAHSACADVAQARQEAAQAMVAQKAVAQSTVAALERLAALPRELASAITKDTSKSGVRLLTDLEGLVQLYDLHNFIQRNAPDVGKRLEHEHSEGRPKRGRRRHVGRYQRQIHATLLAHSSNEAFDIASQA